MIVKFICQSADDCQIYLPIRKHEGNPLSHLLDCLNDVKAWLVPNFLILNENRNHAFWPRILAPQTP